MARSIRTESGGVVDDDADDELASAGARHANHDLLRDGRGRLHATAAG